MALEYICAKSVGNRKRIIIPRSANIYKISSTNKISFYYSNPEKKNGMWKTPKGAREMEFDVRDDKIGGYIVIPKFYDSKGNLLKIGNR